MGRVRELKERRYCRHRREVVAAAAVAAAAAAAAVVVVEGDGDGRRRRWIDVIHAHSLSLFLPFLPIYLTVICLRPYLLFSVPPTGRVGICGEYGTYGEEEEELSIFHSTHT